MTTQQLSALLGISQDTIRRWRKAGVIPQGHQVHEFAPIEWGDDDLQAIREFMRSTGRLQHELDEDNKPQPLPVLWRDTLPNDLDEVADLLRDINKK